MDYGFSFLKKYCSLLAGYTNKGPYTAPEFLVLKPHVVENPTESSDVYSFGFMLWYNTLIRHIFTKEVPFREHPFAEMKLLVIEDRYRPRIPDSLPELLITLIKDCWHQSPEKRPSFADVEDTLVRVLAETHA